MSNASAPSRPTRARASMDLDVARGSSGEGDGAIVAGSGGKPRVKPPSQVRCPNCGHWKHPRSLSCKEPGCGCSCAKHQQGIRKKRQFAQIASSDGQWDGTVQRRLVHQVTLLPDSTHRPRLPTKQQRRILPRPSPSTHPRSPSRAQIKFASELMAKSGVVYGLWTAYKDRDGKVKTLSWGSEPWVEKELCGKSGIVDVLWRTKATHFLAGDVDPIVGVDAHAPVNDALARYGLSHLAKTFKTNRVDAAAFVTLDDDALLRLGVDAVGDRAKLLDAARRMASATASAGTRGGGWNDGAGDAGGQGATEDGDDPLGGLSSE